MSVVGLAEEADDLQDGAKQVTHFYVLKNRELIIQKLFTPLVRDNSRVDLIRMSVNLNFHMPCNPIE